MQVVIVNPDDEIIGHKEAGQLAEYDIYRVSALWLTNSTGDILLAKRTPDQLHDPGRWGPPASGVVRAGEDYLSAMIRLAREEIGLDNLRLSELAGFHRNHKYNYFCQWYKAVVDRPAEEFIINRRNLDGLRWFGRSELWRALKASPRDYLTAMGLYLRMFK